MTRIQFTSSINHNTVIEPIAANQDKGIQSHNAIWSFFQNLAALLKICSPIFEYKINQNTTLYLNLSSFNNWLERHHITSIANWKTTNIEIAGLVNDALGTGQKAGISEQNDPGNGNKGNGTADVF
jgi:hypothetical protein